MVNYRICKNNLNLFKTQRQKAPYKIFGFILKKGCWVDCGYWPYPAIGLMMHKTKEEAQRLIDCWIKSDLEKEVIQNKDAWQCINN